MSAIVSQSVRNRVKGLQMSNELPAATFRMKIATNFLVRDCVGCGAKQQPAGDSLVRVIGWRHPGGVMYKITTLQGDPARVRWSRLRSRFPSTRLERQ